MPIMNQPSGLDVYPAELGRLNDVGFDDSVTMAVPNNSDFVNVGWVPERTGVDW